MNVWNKGIKADRVKYPQMGHFKKHSKEAKIKMANAHKGMKNPWSGHTKHSPEWNKKISAALVGDKNPAKQPGIGTKISNAKKGKFHFNQRGERHPNWKGGTAKEYKHQTSRIEYVEWRKAIFQRDNWTCRICEKRSSKENQIYLEGHHINSWIKYPEMRFNVENGITVCKKCHWLIHHRRN